MNEAQLLKTIKASCGYPRVKIELPDSTLKIYIQNAVDWASQYISNYKYTSCSASVNDLTSLGATAVTRVFKRPYSETDSEIDIFRAYTLGNMVGSNIDIQTVAQAQAVISQWEQVKSDGWRFIEGKLYLYNYSGTVVVEYTTDCSLESITDPKWKNYVQQYALALAKEGIGRVRSKFKLSGIPVTFDGDTLLAEGIQQKERLENLMIEQGEGVYYCETT